MAQTSINIQAVKGGSEQHNKREKYLDYVRPELSHLNEYWESSSQAERWADVKRRYEKFTGQKMQKKATPIREGVVVIEQDTTMSDLKKLANELHIRFGIKTFQISIHKDEGHANAKEWKPNLHAHMVFDWTQDNGKSIRLNRSDMAEMQTIVANVLHMERGKSSDKKHLNAMQYKAEQAKQEAQRAWESAQQAMEQRKAIEIQTEEAKKRKEKAESEAKKLETKKAAKEAVLSVSEGIKGIFGQSSKDKANNALRSEIKALKSEIDTIRANQAKAIEEAVKDEIAKVIQRERNNYLAFYQAINNKSFLVGNEGTTPNEVLFSIRQLKEQYEKTSENATQWMKYAKELEKKEDQRWNKGLRR